MGCVGSKKKKEEDVDEEKDVDGDGGEEGMGEDEIDDQGRPIVRQPSESREARSPRSRPGRANVAEGICPGCNKEWDKYSMKVALGNTWHPECFRCPGCDEKVVGGDFMEGDGFPYHQACYSEKYSPNCDQCGEKLGEQYLSAANKKLHPECMMCSMCNKPLLNQKIFEKNGKLYCEEDFAANFREPCAHCKQPIVGEFVEALGNRYHPDHLHCDKCGISVVGQEFREFRGKVYCAKDVPKPTRRMLVICSKCGETDYRKADNVDPTVLDSLLCRKCEKAHSMAASAMSDVPTKS
mmetsp:Transcript_1898/g.3424  ORF Transcript_1898/g.3424 Transcript_1898/m.3424 type:complete len:295 (+) Transcript_1898:45-929(+)